MRSMTGYGAGAAASKDVAVQVELRGTNQRFLDVKVSAPREYAALETTIRDTVKAAIARGRVDVTITRTVPPSGRRVQVAVRDDLARAYVDAARRLARRLGCDGRLAIADVLRLPDLLEVSAPAPDVRREAPVVQRALRAALRAFQAERRREGAHLAADMTARTKAIAAGVAAVRTRLPAVLDGLRAAARERIARLAADVVLDPARIAHEVALLADRADITEELVRLDGHLAALSAALKSAEPVGKRIEFLLQEMHRELNTAGVKSADPALVERFLGGKGEVEKLREQVQNVE